MKRSVSTSTASSDSDVDGLTAAALSQLTGTMVLNCLGKQPGPPALGADLSHVVDLPQAVRDDLWAVIEPNLDAINTPRSARVIDGYCERHAIDPRAVTPVVGACRFLFRRGAENNTPASLIEEDIKQLLAQADSDEGVVEAVLAALVPCYERAATRLRMKAVHEALTDHGRVVTDIKWRVDDVRHANGGDALDVPVTLLTLRYREGESTGQVTLQLLPNELKMLQDACAQALR